MSSNLSAIKRLTYAGAGMLASLLLFGAAYANDSETVVADITFVDVISITENSALVFGMVDQALANTETIIVSTANVVSGTGSSRVIGTPAAANLTVAATAGQPISILVDNITDGSGYALSAFTCDYNGGGTTGSCSSAMNIATPIASATLLVGATLTGDGTATTNTSGADGSFVVNVTYQ